MLSGIDTFFADYPLILSFVHNENVQALALTTAVTLAARYLSPKAKIIWGVGHGFTHSIPTQQNKQTPPLLVELRTIHFHNAGRAPAKGIEIYLNYKPTNLQLWPSIEHQEVITQDGRFIIKIPFLREREGFSMEILHATSEAPDLLQVRSEVGKCFMVPMRHMRIFPAWVNFTILGLMFIGAYTTVFWALKLIN